MNQFDIFSWHPPGWPEPHPCVIVSNPARVVNKPEIEVIVCSTQRAGRPAQPHEFILDEADGLDWPTLCKCDLIYAVDRNKIKHRRGHVIPDRQSGLLKRIISAHGWSEVLAR